MALINGEYRTTVRELIEELERENPDAVVVVHGSFPDHKEHYGSTSVYKMEAAVDDSCVFLYMGGKWPIR